MFSSIYPHPTVVSAGSSIPTVKFPQDIQVILRADHSASGNLFISNVEAAENKTILENLKISAILCVAKGYGTKHSSSVIKHSKYIPIEEEEPSEISHHLSQGIRFIADNLKKTNVLVHCVAGTNRSVIFVMAYLMKEMNLSLEDAFNEVKSRRKICPSEGMMNQLKNFEKNLNNNRSISQKINKQEPSRLNTPSIDEPIRQRSIRIQTNQNTSNLMEIGSARGSRTDRKVRMDELDERRSLRPSSSYHSNLIQMNHPRVNYKNPQENSISQQSKTQKAPSEINKSFYTPSQASHTDKRDPHQDKSGKQTVRKTNRQEFMAKLQKTEIKNSQINSRIQSIQERFDHSAQNNKMEMEIQLNELTQLRSNLQNRQSQRKEKAMQRKMLHDKSMENREVREYMASLPLETAIKRFI